MNIFKRLIRQLPAMILIGLTVGYSSTSCAFLQDPRKPISDAPVIDPKYVRVEAMLGADMQNWAHYSKAPPDAESWSNGVARFNGGLDINRAVNRHFGLDLGAYTTRYASYTTASQERGTIHSWFVYSSVNSIIPLYKSNFLYGKLGVAYSVNSMDIGAGGEHINYATPLFVLGFNHEVNAHFAMGIQYLLLPGNADLKSQFNIPTSYLLDLVLSYTL